jgi:hypothetical protein
MDPLSITASIVGILTAAGQLHSFLSGVITSGREFPQSLQTALYEAHDVKIIVEGLRKYLDGLVTPRSEYRARLIQVDDVLVSLTGTVLALGELETVVLEFEGFGSIKSSSGGDGYEAGLGIGAVGNERGEVRRKKIPLATRVKWVRSEEKVNRICSRLRTHKESLGVILNILRCDTEIEAARSHESLVTLIDRVVTDNEDMRRRLNMLEDYMGSQSSLKLAGHEDDEDEGYTDDDAATIVQVDSNESSLSLVDTLTENHWTEKVEDESGFEDDLKASRVYRRVKNDSCDSSFTTSILGGRAWSVFSGQSLSEVSVLSAIALPITWDEIENRHHYEGAPTMVPKDLEVLPSMRRKPAKRDKEVSALGSQEIILNASDKFSFRKKKAKQNKYRPRPSRHAS